MRTVIIIVITAPSHQQSPIIIHHTHTTIRQLFIMSFTGNEVDNHDRIKVIMDTMSGWNSPYNFNILRANDVVEEIDITQILFQSDD